jgi:ribonuclease R
MAAERDTTDRYLAAWLSDRVGAEFTGRISGVQRFGLFVRLDESGADGLIPIREIGREFFHFHPDSQTLMGADTGLTLGIGQRVTVRLTEAVPVTGGLLLELVAIEDKGLPSGRAARARKGGHPRMGGRAPAKSRKVVRTRR